MSIASLDVDADGIALISLDDMSRPVNVVYPAWVAEMIALVERIAEQENVRGTIITSKKPTFMAGADLKYLMGLIDAGVTVDQALDLSYQASVRLHRRIETCGKPFVAAINGAALGGGFELCLACHHRVIVDDPKVRVGLPEVTVGLLPGSGGTQRMARMLGMKRALDLLLSGKALGPAEAQQMGLVDAIAPATRLIDSARAWILSGPDVVRPWDKPDYRPREAGGLLDPAVAQLMTGQVAATAARTARNYPAPIAIISSVFEGLQLSMDDALRVEAKYFAKLLTHSAAQNIVRTTFVNKHAADALVRRPANIPQGNVHKLAVLGAGMMGAGIAHVAAIAGISVALLDSTLEAARQGKSRSAELFAKDVQRGTRTATQAEACLNRIFPTTDYADLEGCDFAIEAVFEDGAIKADVTRKTAAVIPAQAIFASNTSTLPITGLAEAYPHPERFIGLHFFSPVERMALVEVIVGKKTSPATVAHALDLVAKLRKTPILVNDRRGFYTSRVFQTFVFEGMGMLLEGILPPLIENSARMVGMPTGPLALVDETSLELNWAVVEKATAEIGKSYTPPHGTEALRRMLQAYKRLGRRHGGGFYDYPEGGRKRLWPGLATVFPARAEQPAAKEIGKRLLYIQALETARCMDDGVLTDQADADIGAVLGWGFPAYLGGPLSLIDTVGHGVFVSECRELARKFGPRFEPPPSLTRRGADRRSMLAERGNANAPADF